MLGTLYGSSILLDSVIIGISWDGNLIHLYSLYRFSAAMAIIILILKPLILYVTLKMARERELDRGGQNPSVVDSFPSFGNWKSAPNTTTAAYQNTGGYQATDN